MIANDHCISDGVHDIHRRIQNIVFERQRARLLTVVALGLTGCAAAFLFLVTSVADWGMISRAQTISPMLDADAMTPRNDPFPQREMTHAAPAPLPRFDHRVGAYLTPSSVGRKDFFREIIDRTVAVGGNAIVFDVKGGAVHFAAELPLAGEIGMIHPRYELPDVIRLARENGLYTIGRYVALKDPLLAEKRPETRIRHPKTGKSFGALWVDGAHETVLSYNREVIRALALSGIDEINLDYIRFGSELPPHSVGYTVEEKAANIEAFIRMARQTIDETNPRVRLGISTYAILGWNYSVNLERIGQDVVRYAPLVDVISPMAYPSTFAEGAYYVPGKHKGPRNYYLVYRTLEGYKELLGPQHSEKIRPWLQAYGMTTEGVRQQINAVYDAGLCGYTFWSAENAYDSVFKALKNLPARPERCL